MTSLIERLKSAEEPDRELDALIWSEIVFPDGGRYMRDSDGRLFVNVMHVRGASTDVMERVDWREPGPYDLCRTPPQYTSSLDAALALVEAKLPGWGYFLRKDDDCCTAGLLCKDAMRVTPGVASHDTQAMAVCIALLIALEHVSLSRAPAEGDDNG